MVVAVDAAAPIANPAGMEDAIPVGFLFTFIPLSPLHTPYSGSSKKEPGQAELVPA